MEFWMVWVAGRGAPRMVYDKFEDAVKAAERLRAEVTGREVYVLAPVHRIDGRKLIKLRPGFGTHAQKVEIDPVKDAERQAKIRAKLERSEKRRAARMPE